ncbi:glycoside hydrolase superfamily [Mycena leptocephala]|nr:glycoside hydrolase superfamily [Mycena leptocephala]
MVARSPQTFLLALPLLSYVAANAVIWRSPPKAHDVIVQRPNAPISSGPLGMDTLKLAPRWNTAITGDQWWTDYQPVSYILTSKRGDCAQYANMVSTCAAAGVGIIQDVVMNHMTAGSGVGFAGSSYTKYSYPAVPYTSSNFHYCAGNGEAAGVTDLNNVTNVRFCEVGFRIALPQPFIDRQRSSTGLPIWRKSSQPSRKPSRPTSKTSCPSSAPFLRSSAINGPALISSQGVSGFRVDAAAYMEPANLSAIYSALSGSPYRTQEVYDGGASNPPMYDMIGDVIEFGATSYVMQAFLGTSGTFMTTVSNLVTPVPMNTAWDLIPSNVANFIMANQDTERSSPPDSLNYLSPNNAYVLGAIFMLGFNYGTPTVYSGYDYSTYDIGAPQDSKGNTSPVTCFENGWRCEQEWIAIANMVLYHNAVGSATLTNVFVGTEQQVAFGRGSTGFLVINNEGSTWTETFTTSLPAGTYCDIIHDTDVAPSTCSGPSYVVSSSGKFTASIAAYDALALFSGFS